MGREEVSGPYTILKPGDPNHGREDGWIVVHQGQLDKWRRDHGKRPVGLGILCADSDYAETVRKALNKLTTA